MSNMDLRQIEYFVALYDERSITKAARRLNVVQPALSMQIIRLEKTFNAKLFERTSRGVIPTDIGRTFYGFCTKIMGDVYEARRYLREANGMITGDLKVGLMPSVANSVLAGVLAKYSASYPDVTVRVVEAYSDGLFDQLNSGKLDFAVVNSTSALRNIAIEPIFRDYLVLVTRFERAKRVPPEIQGYRLLDYKLVLPSQRQGMRLLLDSALASKQIILKPAIELDSLGPTLELVRQSDWATILPIVAVKRAVNQRLIRSQRIVEPDTPREVFVATPATRALSLAAELFIKMIKASINDLLESKD
jgi:LysR family nitrogen assimilation transcriptional regulator